MTGTTPGGWPYVLPADKPLEFPAHSQALASRLDTWLGQSMYYLQLTRTTDQNITAGSSYDVAWETKGGDSDNREFTWTSSGITIPATGIYLAFIEVETQSSSATAGVQIYLLSGGNYIGLGHGDDMGVANSAYRFPLTAIRPFNTGNVISARVGAVGSAVTLREARLTMVGPLGVTPGV